MKKMIVGLIIGVSCFAGNLTVDQCVKLSDLVYAIIKYKNNGHSIGDVYKVMKPKTDAEKKVYALIYSLSGDPKTASAEMLSTCLKRVK